MQGFVECGYTAIKWIKRQIIDNLTQTFEFFARLQKFDRGFGLTLFQCAGFGECGTFGSQDIGFLNPHFDIARVKIQRHFQCLTHHDDGKPRWQAQLQARLSAPRTPFGRAGFQNDGFAVRLGRITRILILINRLFRHDQHYRARKIGGIHPAPFGQGLHRITKNRRTGNGIGLFDARCGHEYSPQAFDL